MLTMMLFMGIASTVVEMMLVLRVPAMQTIFEKYQVLGLIFSIALSFLLGMLFGMGGLIVGGAAIFSTMLSALIYNANLIPVMKALPGQYRSAKNGALKTWHEFQGIIHLVYLVISFPFRVVAAGLRFINRLSLRVSK